MERRLSSHGSWPLNHLDAIALPDPGLVFDYNRYMYVRGNPLKYRDPSGHCVTNEQEITRGDAYDCTIDELDALSWETRKWWLNMFMNDSNVRWFYNILGIIDYFAGNPNFSSIGGWASYSDAGVLVVIQDGWRRNIGKAPVETGDASMLASGQWKEFFRLQHNLGDDNPLVSQQWGIAEQAGVNYGTAVASHLREGADASTQIQIGAFVWFGNRYRDLIAREGFTGFFAPVAYALASDQLNPRTEASQNFVNGFSNWIISPISTSLWGNYEAYSNGYHP
jgi:hypothetical protein